MWRHMHVYDTQKPMHEYVNYMHIRMYMDGMEWSGMELNVM